MSLRLAWAGPWNGRSAIAEFGTEIVAELAGRGHRVEVLRTETGEALALPPRPAPGPIRPIGDVPPHVLRHDYDAAIVNLGDNFPFHGAAIAPLLQVPVVAVFHDAFLAHLYAEWMAATGAGPSCAALGDLYGEAETAEPFWLPLHEMAVRRPMIEWFAGFAAGAVVHARHYAERVRAACPGPVEVIPLALSYSGLPPPPPPGETLVVATIGHANANKCTEAVIRALAASPDLRRRACYRVIGPVNPAEQARLENLALTLEAPRPIFTGWVDDAELARQLANVDVLSCLRNPVLEGASASLILALRSGRPTLVSAHGPYADLPDDVVLKCPPDDPVESLQRHLEAVLRDPAAARAMGERGRRYAEATFSPRSYVDALLPLLERAAAGAPAIHAAVRLGRTLAGFGMAPRDPAAARIAEALGGFFGPGA